MMPTRVRWLTVAQLVPSYTRGSREGELTMAIIYWTNVVGGDFGTATNWSTDTVPGASDQARIDDGSGATVSADETVLSLATTTGGSLAINGGESFTMLEGTGIGANVGTIYLFDSAKLVAGGTIDNTGYIVLASTSDPTQLVTAPGDYLTLSGDGHVDMSGDAEVDITTNVSNTISGEGTISLSNNEKKGVINANANGVLTVNASNQTLINAGTLEATDSGILSLKGTIDGSSGGLIDAVGASANVSLNDVTLIGGTLKTSGGGTIYATTDITLDGVTAPVNNEDDLVLDLSVNSVTFEGTINNLGSINEIFAAGFGGTIAINAAGATLEGGGTISLNGGSLTSNAASAKLTNVNNTISGSGLIGNSGSNTLTLINKGVIDGSGGDGIISVGPSGEGEPLIIDTGTNAITNTGTLEATNFEATGELYIASPVTNSDGTLLANDGELVAAGAVAGGRAEIYGSGTIEFGAVSTTNVRFNIGSTGELIFDDAVQFTGSVVGFGANTTQSIDLPDVQFATLSKSYLPASPNTTGTLTVKDTAGDIAHIKLSGTYSLANFSFANDGGGGTLITDPPVDQKNHTIASGATLTLTTAATGTDTFTGKSGTLVLDDASGFRGKIAGFGGQDLVDLADIGFGSKTTLGFAANGTAGGELKVSDGIHAANIALLGNYMASTFAIASDGHGGTLITDVPHAQQGILTLPLV
jgi:hypothetical protein